MEAPSANKSVLPGKIPKGKGMRSTKKGRIEARILEGKEKTKKGKTGFQSWVVLTWGVGGDCRHNWQRKVKKGGNVGSDYLDEFRGPT